MAFKQSGGFRGGDRKGGFGHSNGNGSRSQFSRPSFNGGKGMHDRAERPELFPATCSTCGKGCEVPFRPSGDRPIFCRDCFGEKRGAADGGYVRKDAPERSFQKREFTPSYAPKPAPASDTRIDDLKHQMEAMHKKVDALTQMVAEMKAR